VEGRPPNEAVYPTGSQDTCGAGSLSFFTCLKYLAFTGAISRRIYQKEKIFGR
jgi:hypothetical protein